MTSPKAGSPTKSPKASPKAYPKISPSSSREGKSPVYRPSERGKHKCEVKFSEGNRNLVVYLAIIFCFVLFLAGFMDFLTTFITRSILAVKSGVFQDKYNYVYLLFVLGVSSFFEMLVGMYGISKVLSYKRRAEEEEENDDYEKKQGLSSSLRILVFLGTFLALFGIAAFIFVWVDRGKLKGGLKDGVAHNMNNYRTDNRLKEEMNLLQSTYECCGGNGPSDWFITEWFERQTQMPLILEPYRSKLTVEGKYIGEDVPFSCCDKREVSCIFYDVNNKLEIYSPFESAAKMKTIYGRGCTQKLIDDLSPLINYLWWFRFAVAFLDIATILCLRLISTAFDSQFIKRHIPPLAYIW